MKTIIFKITSIVVLATMSIHAQSFQKAQLDLDLGIGLGNSIIGTGNTNVIPPLSTSIDFGITNDISIGGYLGFTGASYSYSAWENCGKGNGFGQYYTDTYKWSYFILGVRGAYHFGRFIKIDKLDVYTGLMIGNDFAQSSYSTTSTCPDHAVYVSPTYGGIVFSAYGGARYRFTDHFGVFAELGYAVAYLNMGVNLKF